MDADFIPGTLTRDMRTHLLVGAFTNQSSSRFSFSMPTSKETFPQY